jgi:hypothetical protein
MLKSIAAKLNLPPKQQPRSRAGLAAPLATRTDECRRDLPPVRRHSRAFDTAGDGLGDLEHASRRELPLMVRPAQNVLPIEGRTCGGTGENSSRMAGAVTAAR